MEEAQNYIYSDDFYRIIPDKNNLGRLVSKVDGKGNILIFDDEGSLLSLTKPQFDEILKILNF